MKYFRTKDKILKANTPHLWENDIINQADTIEELCDEFVIETDRKRYIYNKCFRELQKEDDIYDSSYGLLKIKNKYGAIWTDKGLIYVAKMNEKGELELL